MLKTINNLDNYISNSLKNPYVKYSILALLVFFTISIKSISTNKLETINNKLVLLVLALCVIYLVYIDMVLALALTLFIIVCIQEYNTRKTILHLNNNNDIAIGKLDNSNNNIPANLNTDADAKTNLEKRMNEIKNVIEAEANNVVVTNEFKKQMRVVAPSSYGEMIETPMNMTTELKYENQIGKIDLSSRGMDNVYAVVDDKMQDLKGMYAKVNMGQSVNEAFGDVNNELEKVQYDHPSSKTITELLRVKDVDYVNDANLKMIQTNETGLKNIPCAVESITGSLNAQSFK